VKNPVQLPEFQGFLLPRLLVAAKNAPFHAHNKEKETRNRAKMVVIFYLRGCKVLEQLGNGGSLEGR
jgi:hypothetical protein